ncbi:MAG TPA: hypothetical protein VLE49_19730 [Anaerolineales bacterium]|nr:hypothetical protein [Anaerolineales bacterium]
MNKSKQSSNVPALKGPPVKESELANPETAVSSKRYDLQAILKRPLSLVAATLALLLIIYEGSQIAGGHIYQKALDKMDATTLVELGILTLLGVFALRDKTDLQAISFTLVAGLSFVFMYEAIYKWSFYLVPFRADIQMPPPELRELIIFVGIAATILTGFSNHFFTFKKWTFLFLGLFVALYAFWMLVGFPQITNESFYPQIIPINFTHEMTYAINRGTKFVMYLAYLTLFPPLRKI